MNIFGFTNYDAVSGLIAVTMVGLFFGFLMGFLRYLLLEPITGNKVYDLMKGGE